jgi:signal transduction histidine kinase
MKTQPESEKVLSSREITALNENVMLHLYRTISIIALQMVNVRAARQHRLVPYSLRLLSNNFYSEHVYITQFTDSCGGECSIYYNWQKNNSVSGADLKQQTIPSTYVHNEHLKGGAVVFVGFNDVTVTAMDDSRLKFYPGMYGEIHIPLQNRKKTIGVLSFDTMQRRIVPHVQLLHPMKIAALLIANLLILNQGKEKNSLGPLNDPYKHEEISSLQRMVLLKNRLISTVSHELRTPLTGIIGLTQALRMSGVTLTEDEKDTFLGIIENEGKRLAALIRDLLDMSVSEIDGMKLSLSHFRLTELVSEVTTLMDKLSGKMEIITQLKDDIVIHADKDRIKQVLIILLDNALKHGGNRCTITASVDNKESRVVLGVADNGPGILAEDQKRVFESFYTTGSLRGKKAESTGLGLSIAKKIVESHGGAIWVESIPGNGCTFLIAIPI